MNFRKIFATLILAAAAFGAFPCQYVNPTGGVSSDYYRDPYRINHRRFFYLSGINSEGNHISTITRSDVNGYDTISYSASNYATVSLPLTVYVGVADFYSLHGYVISYSDQQFKFGSEMQEITFILQYRVMPESTWHTAAVKKFASGDVAALSKKKVFGDISIDCDAPTGSTVLVRLYVAVNALFLYGTRNATFPHYSELLQEGRMWWGNGTRSQDASSLFRQYIENADMESATVSSVSEIATTEVHHGVFSLDGIDNYLSTTLHMGGNVDYLSEYVYYNGVPYENPQYQDGWTPQFVMAVKIGSKRRPGK